MPDVREPNGRTERADADTWLEAARQVVAAARASDVRELELTHGSFRVRVRRDAEAVPLLLRPRVAPAADPPAATADHLHRVVAPLTGVFYRAPSPAAKPYVAEGDWVDAETVIGLVEAMKIFNEVTADRAGRVAAFLVQSTQLVHAGDALAVLEPGERSPAAPEGM